MSAGQRPISDFLQAQGTFPYEGYPAWTFFFGLWDPDNQYILNLDYAGVASRWIEANSGVSIGTTFDGFVSERPLRDGTTEVYVVLHTRNALAYAYDNTSGDTRDWTELRFLFGYAPPEVVAGSPIVVGDCTMQAKFINPAPPGGPLPDLQNPELQLLVLSFVAQATGVLREGFGVPEGTLGFAQSRQSGLIATSAIANPMSRVALDAFPAEKVIIRPIGK